MAQITIENKTFVIPEKNSPCNLWRTYFEQLKQAVGKKQAKTIWLVTWGENGATTCTLKPEFNNWLKQYDIQVANTSAKAVADLSSIGGNVLGLGKRMTYIASIGTPVLLGGAALAVLLLLYNTAKRGDITDLAMLHPAGRAQRIGTKAIIS